MQTPSLLLLLLLLLLLQAGARWEQLVMLRQQDRDLGHAQHLQRGAAGPGSDT